MKIFLILFALAFSSGIFAQLLSFTKDIQAQAGVTLGYTNSSYTYKLRSSTTDHLIPTIGLKAQLSLNINEKISLVTSLQGSYLRKNFEASSTAFLPDNVTVLNTREFGFSIEGMYADISFGVKRKIFNDKSSVTFGVGLLQNILIEIDERNAGVDFFSTVLTIDGSPPSEFRELTIPFELNRERADIPLDQKTDFYICASYEYRVTSILLVDFHVQKYLNSKESNFRNLSRIGASLMIEL